MAVMVEAVEAEHTQAFEDFFDAHYERLLRVLFLATGDRHEAEDLAQDAFVRLYERWPRVGRLQNPAGYLYRVALNARRSRLRRIRVAAAKAFRLRPEPPADPQEAAENRLSVRRAMAALPPGQREVVVLVEWLDLTDVEAGEVLRLSPGAVRTRLHRARSTLRELLRGDEDV
jgi:RNA polymerase sigma-70 factor (sigma-E family)